MGTPDLVQAFGPEINNRLLTVALDRLYSRRGLRVRMYDLRGTIFMALLAAILMRPVAAGDEVPPIIYAPFRGSDRQRHSEYIL